jgi:hypothetical protein
MIDDRKLDGNLGSNLCKEVIDHGNDFAGNPGAAVGRSAADMAVQFRMGLLPQWRTWIDRGDFAGPAPDGAAVAAG